MRSKGSTQLEPAALGRGVTPAVPASSGTRPAAARRRRVLLVEDEDMVRKVITRMLTAT